MPRLLQLALLLTLAAPAGAQFHLPGSKHTDRPDRPRKSDLEWLWQYGPSDSAKDGRENDLVQDLRFRPLLAQYLTAPQSFWGMATNGHYRALADTALDYLSVPDRVLADDNRYLSISGCVVHFCPARGLLWVDLNAPPNGPAPLLAFAAIDWIKQGKTTSEPGAEYTLWLFPNQALSIEAGAPNRLPPALTKSLTRWAAEPMSGSGIVQNITHVLLVDPDGTPHEVPLAAVGLKPITLKEAQP